MVKAYMSKSGVFSGDPQEAARQTWGGDMPDDLRAGRRERIHLIPIDEIVPDLQQPRRAVPSSVRAVVPNARHAIQWLQVWNDQVGFHLGQITQDVIEQQWEPPADFEPRPVESAWLKLLELASSIRRDGLTNPVTLVKQGDLFVLETGERRWLAYGLLHFFYGDDYARIPARIVDRFDVWRQATENNARSDLNAIGRARQLAILLMDVLGIQTFQPFEAFDFELDFYAQVADGELYRIPRGQGPRMVAAMGLSNVVQLRQYRALLRLPRELWIRADDENWTENAIRQMVDNVTGVTVDPPAPPDQSADPAKNAAESRELDAVFETITAVITDEKPTQLKLPGFDRAGRYRLKRIINWGAEIEVRDDGDRRAKLDEVRAAIDGLREIERRLNG